MAKVIGAQVSDEIAAKVEELRKERGNCSASAVVRQLLNESPIIAAMIKGE
jgi:hypothetical protein